MNNISKAIKEFIDSEGVVEIPDLALVNLYYGMRAVLNRLDNEVSELSFEVKYPDEGERKDILTQLHAVDDFCAALRRQITFHQRKREVMEKMMLQTQHDPNFDDVDPEQKAQAMAMHHCGQDCDCDDACCQAGSPCGRSAAAKEPVITGESLKELVGMQVVSVNGEKCDYCVSRYNAPCVKVELVGGYYICLAPLPNSIVTE